MRVDDGSTASTARAQNYAAQLQATDAEVRDLIDSIPDRARHLVTPHHGYAYLARAYGLRVLGSVEKPLTRDKLMNLARGREWDALERSIDVQISRLRKMIEPDPAQPRYIQTVWGVGYVFVPDGAS